MNSNDIAKLEQQLGLKLPKKYVDFVQKYEAKCADWPEDNRMGERVLTSLEDLLRLNQAIRQCPEKYVTSPLQLKRSWPDYLFVFGRVGNDLYDVIDTREKNPRLLFISNKQLADNIAKKNLTELYQLIKWQHRGAWQNAREQEQEAERRKKAEQRRARRKPRPPAAEPDLIAEGRLLSRSALALRPEGVDYVAVWGGEGVVSHSKKGTWEHIVSISCNALPQNPRQLTGVISLYMSVEKERFGKTVVVHDPAAELPGSTEAEKLFGHPFDCLPPVEVVLYKGSRAVKDWVDDIGWTPDDDYPLLSPVLAYVTEFEQRHPLYTCDCDAMLGGWPVPFPEGDWKKFVNKPLLLLTFRDAEPYYELWGDGQRLKCVERIT